MRRAAAFAIGLALVSWFAVAKCCPTTGPGPGFQIGMNLAGLSNYPYATSPPTNAQLDYWLTKGVRYLRIPVNWEFIQPTLAAALNATYTGYIDALAAHAAANGQHLLLDIHNFAQYNLSGTEYLIGTAQVPVADFTDLWTRMATHYTGMAGIWGYDLMNEPCCGISLATWQTAAQNAVTAIRGVDTSTLILVEGLGFSACPQWVSNNNTLAVTDTANRLIYACHNYADSPNSGVYTLPYALDGATQPVMYDRFMVGLGWAQPLSLTMIHGEGGVPFYDPNWLNVLDYFYTYLQAENAMTFYWAGGADWGTTYELNAEPKSTFMGVTLPASGTRDAGQVAVFTKYTGGSEPTSYFCQGPAQGPSAFASALIYCQFFGTLGSAITVTPADAGNGGTFTPSIGTLAAGTFNPYVTFTYTPASAGSKTWSYTNSGSLTNPANQTFTSIATAGLSAYEYMAAPVQFAWAPFKLISTYSATGQSLTIKRASDSTSTTLSLSGGVLTQSAITTFCASTTCRVTTLYDQSGHGNNATVIGGAVGPIPVVNGQSGLLTLNFDVNTGGGEGFTTSASINGAPGMSMFTTAKPASDSDFIFTFANDLYYPRGGKLDGSAFNAPAIDAGLTDTSAYHADAAVMQMGDFPNASSTYLDGGAIATGPGLDATAPIGSSLALGFYYAPGGSYVGFAGQFVLISGAVSACDISRAHTLDQANWGTP